MTCIAEYSESPTDTRQCSQPFTVRQPPREKGLGAAAFEGESVPGKKTSCCLLVSALMIQRHRLGHETGPHSLYPPPSAAMLLRSLEEVQHEWLAAHSVSVSKIQVHPFLSTRSWDYPSGSISPSFERTHLRAWKPGLVLPANNVETLQYTICGLQDR